MSVKIQFAQGVNVGNVGEALTGTTGATVIASDGNAQPGSVSHYRWTWIDVVYGARWTHEGLAFELLGARGVAKEALLGECFREILCADGYKTNAT